MGRVWVKKRVGDLNRELGSKGWGVGPKSEVGGGGGGGGGGGKHMRKGRSTTRMAWTVLNKYFEANPKQS